MGISYNFQPKSVPNKNEYLRMFWAEEGKTKIRMWIMMVNMGLYMPMSVGMSDVLANEEQHKMGTKNDEDDDDDDDDDDNSVHHEENGVRRVRHAKSPLGMVVTTGSTILLRCPQPPPCNGILKMSSHINTTV
ncbi:hypothetical protein AB6A40_001253 [Gnathostoma spinigerum]|uniref:DUF4283 domain-containing protein n=1 Tax=Gnathostoma spinigerum TaxID=75299 RepID=A0ABD6E8R0_9BILA